MLTSMSALSEKGGHPIVGNLQFAATNPDKALDLPAIVIYIISFSSLLASNIYNTFKGFL